MLEARTTQTLSAWRDCDESARPFISLSCRSGELTLPMREKRSMREQAGMERTCEVVGIAVISAIFSRPDIREAARELRTAVDTALKE